MKDLADEIRDVLRRGGTPELYLDTNVILDVAWGRDQTSKRLLHAVEKRGWHCATSFFAYMEALDAEQERVYTRSRVQRGLLSVEDAWRTRHQRNLVPAVLTKIDARIFRVIEAHGLLDLIYLDEPGWDLAIDLAAASNVLATDCIHVACAIAAGCTGLVTSDTTLLKRAAAYIVAAPPEKAVKDIEAVGPPPTPGGH
jgi:predicted nucleic acid-binding protein